MKVHHPFLPYLSLFIISPLIIYPLHWFGHWVFQASKGCTLPCGKKELKAHRVKVDGKS
jgi:hypothetical protein